VATATVGLVVLVAVEGLGMVLDPVRELLVKDTTVDMEATLLHLVRHPPVVAEVAEVLQRLVEMVFTDKALLAERVGLRP